MHDHRQHRTARRLAIALAALLCAGVAAWSVGVGIEARGEARRERAAEHAIEIIAVRAELRRVLLDDANTQMLAVFGEASDDDLAIVAARRLGATDAALEGMTTLSRSDDVAVSAEALVLRRLLELDDLQVARDADPIALYDRSWEVLEEGRPAAMGISDDVLALVDLTRVDSPGAFVLNDALDAAYTLSGPDVPAHMEDYVARSEPYIRGGAGYLGPDREAPLVDSAFDSGEAPRPHPELAGIERRVAVSALWEYDGWVRSWVDGDPGPAPLTLAELEREAGAVDREIRSIVDSELAAARRPHATAAERASRRALIASGAAGAALVALFALAVAIVMRRWRAIRSAVAQGGRDQLTGVHNRYQLEQIESLIARSHTDAHLVAAVDLDGFKRINDRLGHRAGDVVLVEVARRLQMLVEHRCTPDGAVTGSVVRMGGDEFVVTLHSRGDIDVASIRDELDGIRTGTIEVAGHQVQLGFSIGLAHARGASGLHDLVDAADRAAYEDKARRRAGPGRGGAEHVEHVESSDSVKSTEVSVN